MKHIPNILSTCRILLIPFFIWFMVEDQFFQAAIILAVSGLTDLLDGFLARRFNWVSQVGKVLDPVADKLTQVTVCIILAVKIRFLLPFFVIMLCKDFIMLLLGGQLVARGVKLEGAKWFGKLSTILFYVVMTAILFFPNIPKTGVYIMVALATTTALISILMYVPEYRSYLAQAKQNKTPLQ